MHYVYRISCISFIIRSNLHNEICEINFFRNCHQIKEVTTGRGGVEAGRVEACGRLGVGEAGSQAGRGKAGVGLSHAFTILDGLRPSINMRLFPYSSRLGDKNMD